MEDIKLINPLYLDFNKKISRQKNTRVSSDELIKIPSDNLQSIVKSQMKNSNNDDKSHRQYKQQLKTKISMSLLNKYKKIKKSFTIETYIKIITSTLTQIIKENESIGKTREITELDRTSNFSENQIELLHLHRLFEGRFTKLSLEEYLLRIYTYTRFELSSLMLMSIYIDKLCKENNLILTSNNVYKIVLAAIVIAIKFNEDFIPNNESFAKIGLVSVQELNDLEFVFMESSKYKFFISPSFFEQYLNFLLL